MHKAFLSCSCVGTAVEQILIIDNLGFDESALEIGVDFSGCLRCFCSDFDGPCTGLILSCCKEAHEAEQTVACCDQFFKAGFL